MDRVKQWKFIDKALAGRISENRLRSLKSLVPDPEGTIVHSDGKTLINFSSNDYLGLSKHPDLIKNSAEYASKYGAGSTASRLISGTYDIHLQLEEKLAETFNTEAALVFNSGFQANSTIVSALTDRNSLVLADKLSHNSLLQGALLSRADFQRFEHNDLSHLKTLLKRSDSVNYNRILILTESIFSMDGDRADLDRIIKLAGQHNAMLFVDDAHATGAWGEKGLGLTCGKDGIDIILGTFGKAFGVFGAYVLCSEKLRQYLINFCSGFIYTTALPPPVIGALDAALDLIPEMEDERATYHKNIDHIRNNIIELGYDTGSSSTQIIPVIIGNENKTLALSEFLEINGILATAIRPPTVPERSSRIRITISSKHTGEQISHLITTLDQWNGR